MKISFLLPSVGMSGGIRVAVIYASMLAKKGHDVTVFSPAPKKPTLAEIFRSVAKEKKWPNNKSSRTSHLDGSGVKHVMFDGKAPPTHSDISAADVLISTWWETAEWSANLPMNRGARVYFIQHHEVFDYLPVERCKATYRLPFHKIVVAQWISDLMANTYQDSQCELVSNAVDHKLFYAKSRSKQARPTVGFLYHEAPFKAVDTSLKIVKQLKSRIPDLRIIAIGSRKPSGMFDMDQSIELAINPPQNSIRDIYAKCDIWLTASRSEGFNLMPMEAMACRTPVVSTKTGWPLESIKDGVNGFLFDIDHVDQGVDATFRILTSSNSEWCVMSESAYSTVEHSSWDNAAQLFEQSLTHACKRAIQKEIMGQCGG